MLPVVLLVGLTAAPVVAPAVDVSAEDQVRFKTFFTRGEELYSQGDYGGAIWNFRQADAIRATPEVAYDLAKCHEKLGDAAFSAFYYRLYLKRAPGAGDALEVAERIAEALAHAEAEGRGLLEVEAPVKGSVVVDEKFYPEFPAALFLPPGDYELVASFASGARRQTVSIRTGKSTSVELEPFPPPLLAAWSVSDPAVVQLDAPPAGTLPSAELRKASYAVLAASGVALALGTVFGALASADAGRLEHERSALTVSQAGAIAASANARGGTANALWIIGGAGAVAGGVLFGMTLPELGLARGGRR